MAFPSFKTWCSALRLSILAYSGIVLFPFYAWCYFLFSLLLLFASGFQIDSCLLLMAITLAFLIIGFLFYIAIKVLFRFILWILWSKPPEWLLPAISMRVNLHKYTVLSASALPLAIIFMLIIAVEVNIEMLTQVEIIKHKDFVANLLMRFFWLWFIASAYLLHWFPIRRCN